MLLVYKKNFEGVHDESLESVKDVLNSKSSKIRSTYVLESKFDLTSSVETWLLFGGDGTLTISHNIDSNTPVMGVNSHPRSDVMARMDFTWIVMLIPLKDLEAVNGQ